MTEAGESGMTEHGHVPNMDGPADGDPRVDELHADIAATRADLQDTVDAISAKLDVKAQGKQKVADAKDKLAATAARVKQSAPEPVEQLIDRAATTARPAAQQVADKAGPYRNQLIAVSAVALVVTIIVRRRRPD